MQTNRYTTAFTTLGVLMALLVPSIAAAVAQTKDQQRCLNTLYKAARHIAGSKGKQVVACLDRAAKGRLPTGQTLAECIAADANGGTARARSSIARAASTKCSEQPTFGLGTLAKMTESYARTIDVRHMLGRDLDAAVIPVAADKVGARCQKTIVAGLIRLADTKLEQFNLCAREGLKTGDIADVEALAACWGVDPREKIVTRTAKIREAIERKCVTTAVRVAAPGRCIGAPLDGLTTCLQRQADCGVCIALADAGVIARECRPRIAGVAQCTDRPVSDRSAARQWDEEILEAIRHDAPRPTVHARNLFHMSAVMWDAWRAYGGGGRAFLSDESHASDDPEADREIAISYAAYRVLSHRYALSVNASVSQQAFDARMMALDLDPAHVDATGDAPASVGNRIAATMIAYGETDGANEQGNYADPSYTPANEALIVKLGVTTMAEPNRWQPLALDFFQTQNGIPLADKVQTAIGTRWNQVTPFALTKANLDDLYLDPGPPPHLGTATDAEFKASAVRVIELSSHLTPDDGEMIDVSPGAYGNNPLGSNAGTGYPVNPATGEPYASHLVKRGDFGRVLAEFWADGPHSETPPGHWNTLANHVTDHTAPDAKRLAGKGPVLSTLEWDVKLYLALNGAVHDAAVVAWGLKRHYDSVRPISMIRYMGSLGQSSDPTKPSYDPNGLPLVDGLIELITFQTTAVGGRHQALAGREGEIAVVAWPGQPANPLTSHSGVKWVRAVTWLPYQKSTFVTPAFPGYTSGHSTFSRAAAEVLTGFTGSPYFPGGLGEFVAPANEYLTFERGPTTDVRLQWATYYDAADQAGQSRLWGGIHVQADDFNGRVTGSEIGKRAYANAVQYFTGP